MTTPIATALLSYGMSGEIFHAPLLHAHPGFLLHSVWHRSGDRARLRYPDVNVAHSLDELLADPAVELVIVNTPNETHFDYTSLALNAGKHVIVEKPFTVTSAEADALIALARDKKKVITVFQNRRWDGDFITLQQVLRDNLLGTVVEAELHYDRFRNYVEANTWKEEMAAGTGILYNLGSHMLDQALVLFGMPKRIDARIGKRRPGGRVDDFYDIRLKYDGMQCIVKSSYLVREQGPRYAVHGVNGSFIKYGIDPQEQDLKEGKSPKTTSWGNEDRAWWGKLNTTIGGVHVEGLVETMPGNYMAFYQNVYEAIREGKPLAVKPEESRNVIKLIELAEESSFEGKSIKCGND